MRRPDTAAALEAGDCQIEADLAMRRDKIKQREAEIRRLHEEIRELHLQRQDPGEDPNWRNFEPA
jgi:hypothetical protein